MSDNYTLTKVCSKCKQEFPATTEFFHQNKKNKDGLSTTCKVCALNRANEWYQNNKLRVQQRQQENRVELNEKSRQWRVKNKARKEEYQRDWREANREQIAEQRRQYRERNKARLAESKRRWDEANKEHLAEYQQVNKERDAENARQYRLANPEKSRIRLQRRRARKHSLPDTFTVEQWFQCLEYHNYCCAVCGAQLRDLFGNVEPHADHWIPLSYEGADNPGTVAENMVCLCNTCNHSKGAKLPTDWLKLEYGLHKAKEILARIQKYFEWIKPE